VYYCTTLLVSFVEIVGLPFLVTVGLIAVYPTIPMPWMRMTMGIMLMRCCGGGSCSACINPVPVEDEGGRGAAYAARHCLWEWRYSKSARPVEERGCSAVSSGQSVGVLLQIVLNMLFA